MILSITKENKVEKAIGRLELSSLIKEFNQKIIKEKEVLYNFSFSAVAYANENLRDNPLNLQMK